MIRLLLVQCLRPALVKCVPSRVYKLNMAEMPTSHMLRDKTIMLNLCIVVQTTLQILHHRDGHTQKCMPHTQ